MSILVSIDPGKYTLGVAVFQNEILVACDAIGRKRASSDLMQARYLAGQTADWLDDRLPQHVDQLVIERMVPRRDLQGAWDRLTTLSHVTGALAMALPAQRVESVKPAVWTKSRPKQVNHQQMQRMLDEGEQGIVDLACSGILATNHKEVCDAVCIGLWKLGRWR